MIQRSAQLIDKDGVALTIGGGTVAYSWLNEVATVAEQIGMIAGCLLVVVTLIHKIYNIIRKSAPEEKDTE